MVKPTRFIFLHLWNNAERALSWVFLVAVVTLPSQRHYTHPFLDWVVKHSRSLWVLYTCLLWEPVTSISGCGDWPGPAVTCSCWVHNALLYSARAWTIRLTRNINTRPWLLLLCIGTTVSDMHHNYYIWVSCSCISPYSLVVQGQDAPGLRRGCIRWPRLLDLWMINNSNGCHSGWRCAWFFFCLWVIWNVIRRSGWVQQS